MSQGEFFFLKKKVQQSNQDEINQEEHMITPYNYELRLKLFEDLSNFLEKNKEAHSSLSEEKLHRFFFCFFVFFFLFFSDSCFFSCTFW